MSNETPFSKPATIYDVAARAGVSHITVSRVVNGKQNVSPETRERVQKAMTELQYTPNAIAQTLQTRRSRTIELITTNPFGSNAAAMTAISGVTHANEYQLTILPTSPDELLDILQTIPNRMVAGSILYAQEVTLDYAAVKRIIKRHPLVHMGGRLQSGLPSVVYDQKLATEQALNYLIEIGHTQIAFISGDMDLLDGLSRYDAYIETMTKNRLTIGPVAYGDFSGRSGEATMTALLNQDMPFTAVFVSSDAMAAAAIHVLRRAGRRVPDDISVIGYDNFEAASYQYPPLTTITNNSAILGRTTAEYLFELMQNPDAPRQQRVLIPDLIIRESTLPPNS